MEAAYFEPRVPGVPRAPADIQEARSALGRLPPAVIGQRRLDLTAANLRYVDLRGLHFDGADFTDADLIGAHLQDAHLEGALFASAVIDGLQLGLAHLRGA